MKLPQAPTTADALHAAYERRAEDWRRDHLGASLLGHDCDRFLWLSFRWAMNPGHSGRMLRLFERGEREEGWLIADLRAAGFEVFDRDVNGEQFRVRWGHVGGSVDGVIVGLVEAPKTPHVLECKTHNAKSFAGLSRGVRRAKPQHWVQMQVYMLGLGLDRAFYLAVNKDTDELYAERVHLDDSAQSWVDRGQRIVQAAEPPERKDRDFPPCVYTSKDGTRWPCQFYDLCHGTKMPEKNCRTCVSATPGEPWACDLGKPADPRVGCSEHCSIPAIVNAQVASVDGRKVTYQFADGSTA